MKKIKFWTLMSGVTAMMTLVLIGAIAGYEAAVIPPIAYIIITILLVAVTYIEFKYVDVLTERYKSHKRYVMRKLERMEMEDMNHEN